MQPTSVFAGAISRLHADLIVIRLRRAGIARGKISAIFPERSKPNCATCWLDGLSKPTMYNGDTVTMAGPMRKQLSIESEAGFVRSLEQIGLGPREATSCAERLSQGQILISVHTGDQSEIAIAWHTFRQLEAEGIALGLSDEVPGRRWFRSARKETEAASPALSFGVAV